jgi:UDP-N-acetylmuramate dehydrogenase
MKDIPNYCLKQHNTFKLDVKCKRYISFDNLYEFVLFGKENQQIFCDKFLVVGEGSNLLFTKDFDGTIINPQTKNFGILRETETEIIIQSEAGLKWDIIVEETLKLNAFGLENLSLIPGTVGASVVQNIGAYGVEVSDFVESVKYFCLEDFVIKTLTKEQCKFDYRNSIFKNELKNKAIVVAVDFNLKKTPACNTTYADIQKYFQSDNDITPIKLRNAVINIRNEKLPDPIVVGNAGSFFKNPVVNTTKFNQLLINFADLRFYDLQNGNYKIAAGWMIDKCGLKGFEYNGAAVHENQALVLINKSGNATGKIIKELSEIIQEKVFDRFDIKIEPEVIIL